MKFSLSILLVATVAVVQASNFKYKRLDKDNAAVLIVDHQVGLFQLVRDSTPEEFRNHVMAHSELGKVFNLPVVITSSADQGPNGPIPDYILDMHPTAPLIRRQGEVNAWDSPDFRAAVKATGKKQMIVAGVTTDVCVSFLTLSLIEAGYEVWTNTAASGTFSTEVRDAANLRMEKAGATTAGTFVIACELMRDWRKTPGALEMLPYFSKYLPIYSDLAAGHKAAVENGTVFPGQ